MHSNERDKLKRGNHTRADNKQELGNYIKRLTVPSDKRSTATSLYEAQGYEGIDGEKGRDYA